MTGISTYLIAAEDDPDKTTQQDAEKVSFIKYIPRDHTMKSVRHKYTSPKRLEETNNPNCGINLARNAQECAYCATLRSTCPDCCVVIPADKSTMDMRCSSGDPTGNYACTPRPFDTSTCAAAQCSEHISDPCPAPSNPGYYPIPNCQEHGCPPGNPEPHGAGDCYAANGFWYCTEDTGGLGDFGCPGNFSALEAFDNLTPFDIIVLPYTSKNPKVELCKNDHCYKYSVSDEYKNALAACRDYCQTWETCRSRVDCCEKNLCSGVGLQACMDCDNRIAATECYNFDADACATIIEDYNNFISDTDTLQNCFQPIDEDNLKSVFVARSNEKVTIIWEIQAESSVREQLKSGSLDDVTFYSLIKVFQEGSNGGYDSQPIHQSPVHTRSMKASFSISAATTLPKGSVEAGRNYKAVLYYFIPGSTVPGGATMDIHWAEITTLRTRE